MFTECRILSVSLLSQLICLPKDTISLQKQDNGILPVYYCKHGTYRVSFLSRLETVVSLYSALFVHVAIQE